MEGRRRFRLECAFGGLSSASVPEKQSSHNRGHDRWCQYCLLTATVSAQCPCVRWSPSIQSTSDDFGGLLLTSIQRISRSGYYIGAQKTSTASSCKAPANNRFLERHTPHYLPPSVTVTRFRMASRALALSLRQASRSRAALNAIQSPVTRGFATPVSYGAKTESTTLSNGFTV